MMNSKRSIFSTKDFSRRFFALFFFQSTALGQYGMGGAVGTDPGQESV